jgi:hypothetical protein
MQEKLKKKYLAFFVTFVNNESINGFVNGYGLLINKISEKFEKIYIINVINLKFFSKKKKVFDYTLNKNFKLPQNIEFYDPQNSNDFKHFMKEKELIGISNFGTRIPELKVFFLLKRHKIRQVQISAVGNAYWKQSLGPIESFFWKNLLWKLKHVYAYKFTVLLSNLGLISKIEIRFISNPDIIRYKKITSSIYKKIFNYYKLSFAKELILINSRSFDIIKSSNIKVDENKIILLDEQLNDCQWSHFRKLLDEKEITEHYYNLNRALKQFSNVYKKKIIVCLHPRDDLESKKKYFSDFEVVKYQTRENIYKAFMVLFFESTAIIDAILLKKRIATIISNAMDENQIKAASHYVDVLGIEKINIEDNAIINTDNKNAFLLKLDKATKNYSNYINSYIAADGNNLGYEKIISTLKSRFF